MKIYLDSINLQHIKKWVDLGIITGVTTNPTLLNQLPFDERIPRLKEICSTVGKLEVSIDITGDTAGDMMEDFRRYEDFVDLSPNVVIKLPATLLGIELVKQVPVEANMTLVFNAAQAFLLSKIPNVRHISVFLGRLDDAPNSPGGIYSLNCIRKLYTILEEEGNPVPNILAANIRNIDHVTQAVGVADIVTIPSKVLDMMLHHDLTLAGVEKFNKDAQK